MKKVLIPKANEQDVMIEDEYRDQIEIIPVETLEDVLDVALAAEDTWLEKLASQLEDIRNQGIGDFGIGDEFAI
jgi:Lon-like ATP-dependent protease